MVILISGFMGVGKTTTAKLLSSIYPNCVILSISEKVKEVAFKYFNWDGVKDIRGRKLLQSIGSVGREYDPYIWVNYTAYKAKLYLEQGKNVLIDDWRFLNEAEVFKNLSEVRLIRVVSTIRGGILSQNFVPDKSEYETVLVSPEDIIVLFNDFEDLDSYKDYLKTLHLLTDSSQIKP